MYKQKEKTDYEKGREIVEVTGVYLHQTEKAALIVFNSIECWLPNSQFAHELEISNVQTGDCTAFIPRWLAEKNGLDYEEHEVEAVEGEDEDESDEDSYEKMMGDMEGTGEGT